MLNTKGRFILLVVRAVSNIKFLQKKKKNCCYNVVGFARNYFSRINCSCQFINKDVACSHCLQLVHSLNSSTIRVCVEANDLPEDFNLIETDK